MRRKVVLGYKKNKKECCRSQRSEDSDREGEEAEEMGEGQVLA